MLPGLFKYNQFEPERHVAIKRLVGVDPTVDELDAAAEKMLLRELLACRIKHANIVSTFGFAIDPVRGP